MPKYPTFPTLLENHQSITISHLKKWGYLTFNTITSGVSSYSGSGKKIASLSLFSNMSLKHPLIRFSYVLNESLVHCNVQLVSLDSNLGRGVIWYFVCPKTGRRCRKLHFMGDYLFHRSAVKDCFYEKQTYSSRIRKLEKNVRLYFGVEKGYEKIASKHFKKFYLGKPTKKYLQLILRIEAGQEFSEYELIYS